jgi:hypothetical protein
MNKIRTLMPSEVEAFIPVIRRTYEAISEYQFDPTRSEVHLRAHILRATREMAKFIPFLQKRWRTYYEILQKQNQFPINDVICAFDSLIHAMHLRAGNRGLKRTGAQIDAQSPWSDEVKAFLEERRQGRM